MPVRKLTTIALIAAIYAVVTWAVAPLSYGPLQLRLSEIFTVLPFITPLAVPGIFIGVLVANLFSPIGIFDIIFGSLASLLAAWLTAKMPRRWLAPLPPVLINAIIIGTLLGVLGEISILAAMLYVGLGQLIVCYGLGLPFLFLLERYRNQIPGERGE